MGNIYDEALVALHGVWRRRWLALGVAWGLGLLGWLVVSLIPNTYKSQARIYVQAASLLPDKVGMSSGEQKANIETVRQLLSSVDNLQKVVRGTDLANHVSSDAEIIAKAGVLQKAITIVAEQDNLFKISAVVAEGSMSDAQNAKLSKAVVQKLVDLFVDGNLRDGRTETGTSLKFLDAQIEQRGQQLAQVEARRATFESKYLSALPGGGSIAERVALARSELSRVSSDYTAAASGLAAVNGQLAGIPATMSTPGSVVNSVDGRVAQILGQIADGQARGWTDNHPDMIVLRGQLARAQVTGGGGARMTPGTSSQNPMYVTLRSMQAEKQATAGALAARKAQLEGEINRILSLQASDPEFSAAQNGLDRDYQALKTQYDKLLADREDLRLRGQVQAQTSPVKFNVVDPPSAPSVPNSPNRPLLLTLVLLAALGAGVGVAFGYGQLQTTYPTATRLERASDLPVVGTITEVIPPSERIVRRKRLTQFAGGTAALVGVWALLMVVEFVQRSMVA